MWKNWYRYVSNCIDVKAPTFTAAVPNKATLLSMCPQKPTEFTASRLRATITARIFEGQTHEKFMK